MWSVQVSSHVLEGWTFITLILTLLLQWVRTLSAWHKGHAGPLDLIFYSVSQHTIRQSAASDPCNLNIGSERCVGSTDGDKYVISCSNSIQHLFITHLPFTETHTRCHRIERNTGTVSTFKELTVLLCDDKSLSCDWEGQTKKGYWRSE